MIIKRFWQFKYESIEETAENGLEGISVEKSYHGSLGIEIIVDIDVLYAVIRDDPVHRADRRLVELLNEFPHVDAVIEFYLNSAKVSVGVIDDGDVGLLMRRISDATSNHEITLEHSNRVR